MTKIAGSGSISHRRPQHCIPPVCPRYGEDEDDEEGEEGAEKAKGKRGNLRPAILEDEALAGQGMGAALKVTSCSNYGLT
jgi:hypothetical protein